MRRILNVFIDTSLVGELSEDNNIWSFVYEPNWLAAPDWSKWVANECRRVCGVTWFLILAFIAALRTFL